MTSTAMGPALAEARPRTSERAQSRPPTLRLAEARPGFSSDAATLVYLQGTAGNAAVVSLLQARGHLPVQRCAGGACNCPPEEREAHETGSAIPVQRGIWDSLSEAASSLLPDSIKSVVTGTSGQAKAAAGELRQQGSAISEHAQGEGATALGQSSAGAETEAAASESEMRTHSQHAEVQTGESIKTGTAGTAQGEAAASGFGSIAGVAAALVNPVGPVVALPEFEQAVQHVGSVLAAIPGGAADLASDLKGAVRDGLKQGHSGAWNCDQSQIMAMAAGVDRAITDAEVKAAKKVLGADRYEELAGWANQRMIDLKSVAASVHDQFEKAKLKLQGFWKDNVTPLINQMKGLMKDLGDLKDRLIKGAGDKFTELKKSAGEAWTNIRNSVITPVIAKAHAAKRRVTQMVADARNAIGKWWGSLPKVAQNMIIGAGLAIAGPFAATLALAEKAGEAFVELEKKLVEKLKKLSDRMLQGFSRQYKELRKKVVEGARAFKERWTALRKKVHQYLAAAYARLDGATGGTITRMSAALVGFKRKIAGQVCTALGAASGPCVKQFVPETIKGVTEADVTLTTNADLTVPVEGVPVKIGRGATLKLTREGDLVKATESGEGLLAVVLKAAGESPKDSVSVDVSGPFGPGLAWKNLTGQEAAAASKPEAGGSSKGPEGPEVEAGYKASLDMEYGFFTDPAKDKTCDGLGGLTAFLGSQGLSHVLPPPFDTFANQAVSASFEDRLTSCIVALMQYGNATFNLKKDGAAGLEAALKNQSKIEVKRKRKDDRDETKGWIDTATLSQTLGVSGAAKVATGGDLPLKAEAGAGLKGTIYANLEYGEKEGVITGLGAGAKLELSLDVDPGKIQAIFPPSVAATLLARLTPYIKAGDKGGLEVEAKYEIMKLDDALRALDKYLADTPATAVNTDGLFNAVHEAMTKARIEQELTVKFSSSQSLAKIGVGVDAKEAGGKVSIEALKNVKRTIYSYKSGGGSESD
jgi:hypothetical protein